MSIKFPIIVYDSNCSLCVRFKQSLSFLDKNNYFDFESVESEQLYLNHSFLKKENCLKEVHLILSENHFVKGPEAIAEILKVFPLASKFTWLIESESGKAAVSSFYKRLDHIRLKIKKSCRNCH